MCITNSIANLSRTKILSFKKDNGNIFLSYSNRVLNRSGEKNVMLLPIPGTVKKDDFYDTTSYNRFLMDISDQTLVSEDYNYGVRYRGSRSLSLKSVDKTKVGMYDISFSKDTDDLLESLRLDGITLSPSLMEFFKEQYPGFTIVACVFDGDQPIDAQPIALEYTPKWSGLIFYPTMDSHDGSRPRSNENVQVDHHIMCESDGVDTKRHTGEVNFSQEVPDFIKSKKYDTYQLNFSDGNGDIFKAKETPRLIRSFANLMVVPSLSV